MDFDCGAYRHCRSVFAQTDPKADSLNSNPNYDEALAEKLGADDYGMKSYFFVVL